jgi:hypothetical protein
MRLKAFTELSLKKSSNIFLIEVIVVHKICSYLPAPRAFAQAAAICIGLSCLNSRIKKICASYLKMSRPRSERIAFCVPPMLLMLSVPPFLSRGQISSGAVLWGIGAFAIYAVKTSSCLFGEPHVQNESVSVKKSEPSIDFDLKKMEVVYDNYTKNFHPGVVMVMLHPCDESLWKTICSVQVAVKHVFDKYQMGELLTLYTQDQVHVAIVELAGEDENLGKPGRHALEECELVTSHRNKRPIDLNYTTQWIAETGPFEIEIGPNALSKERYKEASTKEWLKFTPVGQLLFKGRPKDRTLLATLRGKLEEGGNMLHKYRPDNKPDEELHFVAGYTQPDDRLNNLSLRQDLENCMEEQRSRIQLSYRVKDVSIIVFNRYSLATGARLWERTFALETNPNFDLLTTMRSVMPGISQKCA